MTDGAASGAAGTPQDGGLLEAGAEAFRRGDYPAAQAHFLAAVAARRQVLGNAHPELGASLHNLGSAMRALGNLPGAAACHAEAMEIWERALGVWHPAVARAAMSLAALAREQGDAQAALMLARRALDIREKSLPEGDPQTGLALEELGRAQSAAGDDRAALASWETALAVLLPRIGEGARLAPVLNNCGVAARSLGDLSGAKHWFRRAVAADEGLAAARHNLAAVLARLGEEAESRGQRERALQQTCVFVQRAARPRAHVLIPSLSDLGNVPLEHLLPERDFTRIWWFLAHESASSETELPPFETVFNGIGDPDMDHGALPRLRHFLAARPGLRVLNLPDAVEQTRRDKLEATLAGISGVVVPRTCRIAAAPGRADIMWAAAAAGIAPPVLLRPAGVHGGTGVLRLESWDDLQDDVLPASTTWYLSRYVPCRGADGFFRKYRMAFVDRTPFPYHLAISRHWMVHYFSAGMETHDWKLAEEAAFLADPRAVLGESAMSALNAIGSRLGLDFCGIDFTLLPDGRVLVFEANATMLIHPERDDGRLAFKNPAVARIVEAAGRLVGGCA